MAVRAPASLCIVLGESIVAFIHHQPHWRDIPATCPPAHQRAIRPPRRPRSASSSYPHTSPARLRARHSAFRRQATRYAIITHAVLTAVSVDTYKRHTAKRAARLGAVSRVTRLSDTGLLVIIDLAKGIMSKVSCGRPTLARRVRAHNVGSILARVQARRRGRWWCVLFHSF